MIVIESTGVRILDAEPNLDYFDMQEVRLPQEIGPLEVWNRTMAHPRPFLAFAFHVRDAISSLFGVKRIGGFSGRQAEAVKVGDKLDFFLVEYADQDCLVLTERDRHLDVMTCISTEGEVVKITSSVKVHNLFGHLYMIPVGIAHRWIVRGMLRRLGNQVSA